MSNDGQKFLFNHDFGVADGGQNWSNSGLTINAETRLVQTLVKRGFDHNFGDADDGQTNNGQTLV